MFLHAGFLHLLGNMIFFYLFGPLIEDRYGKPFFALFFIFGGLFAGFMFGLHYPDSEVPLVGASGSVFAVLGGYLLKHWRDKIRFVFIFGFRGRMFAMPAWVAVPFWFLKELLLGYMVSSMGGGASGVAHWAHVWGFVFGAGVVFLVGATGLEQRFWPAPIDLNDPHNNGPIREALHKERLGDIEGALNILRQACREQPDDMDLLQNHWRLAREKSRVQDMLLAGQRLMERDIDSDQAQMAHVRFREILQADKGAHFSPTLLRRLAKALAHDQYHVEAEELLRHCVHTLPNPTARVLFPLLEIAAEMNCAFGLEIADELRTAEGFSRWEETDALVHKIKEAHKQEALPQNNSIAITSDEASIPLADAHEFMETGAPAKAVHALKVFEALPLKLTRQGLTVEVDGKQRQIPFSAIKLVAVGAIREQGKKPVLLIDLAFDRPQDVLAQHRVLRLASHRFNPQTLLPKTENPGKAFRRLAEIFLKASGAPAAPSHEAAMGSPYSNYPDVQSYERDVYYP